VATAPVQERRQWRYRWGSVSKVIIGNLMRTLSVGLA
jgi:hypothetical protein